jgi:hypothetical protein
MIGERWFLTMGFAGSLLALLLAAPADATKRRAFVTSVSGTGDLGSWPDAGAAVGLAAGDAICRARAAAGGLPNASTYRAWLSTGATDAHCHVQGLTGAKGACAGGAGDPAGPWYLRNGITNFTGDLDALTGPDRVIYRPVTLDEFGTELATNSRYWTGTEPDGTPDTGGFYNCSGWDSSNGDDFGYFGRADGTAQYWSHVSHLGCDQSLRLLCFEPGASETVVLGWSPGSIVFVTSAQGSGNLSSWPEAGGFTGLAAGDAICTSLAEGARLPAPDSFVAWLSTAGVDARDRISSDGPFKRIDAYTIANDEADLVDGAISTSIHVDEHGAYLTADRGVWTGTNGEGLGLFFCGEWDTTSGNATYGQAALSRSDQWSHVGPIVGCSLDRSLYCFSNTIVLFWDGFDWTGDPSRWSEVVPAP